MTPFVNDGSTAFLTITFKDKNGDPIVPDSAEYRIDDVDSGNSVKGVTAFSPTLSTHELEITKDENEMVNDDRAFERRRVTVRWLYDGGNSRGVAVFVYEVKNVWKHP